MLKDDNKKIYKSTQLTLGPYVQDWDNPVEKQGKKI